MADEDRGALNGDEQGDGKILPIYKMGDIATVPKAYFISDHAIGRAYFIGGGTEGRACIIGENIGAGTVHKAGEDVID